MIPSADPARRAVALVALLLLSGWPGSGRAEAPGSIPWRSDLARALGEAAADGRLVWVQFTGPGCPNCRRMEAEAFTHPEVIGHAVADFVPVKLSTEQHVETALNYGFSALPATAVLRPTGEVVSRVQGYSDPAAFAGFLRDALARSGRPPRVVTAAVGLGGACPVSLVDARALAAGDPGRTAERAGVVYRFRSESALEAFRKAPERYVPVNGGRCPVARVDRGEARPGSPRFGVFFDGHLYLCAGAEARDRFLKNPGRYGRVDVALRGECPHCWAVDRGLVRPWVSVALSRPPWAR